MIQHRVRAADHAAVLLDRDFDVAPCDVDRQPSNRPRAPPPRASAPRPSSVRLAWLAASCCSIRFSTSLPNLRVRRRHARGGGGARGFLDDPRDVHHDDLRPGRRRSAPAVRRRRSAVSAAAGLDRRGAASTEGWGSARCRSPRPASGGAGTSGAGWNSTRSTSAAVSPSSGATLSRTVCGSGLNGRSGEAGAGDEEPVHAAPDVGSHHFHATADVGRALSGFALSGLLERTHRRRVREEGDGRERHDREQQKCDDQPCSE